MKKNNLETIKAILDESDVEYSVDLEEPMSLELRAGNKNIDGYVGFFSQLYFDSDGKLTGVGVYE